MTSLLADVMSAFGDAIALVSEITEPIVKEWIPKSPTPTDDEGDFFTDSDKMEKGFFISSPEVKIDIDTPYEPTSTYKALKPITRSKRVIPLDSSGKPYTPIPITLSDLTSRRQMKIGRPLYTPIQGIIGAPTTWYDVEAGQIYPLTEVIVM